MKVSSARCRLCTSARRGPGSLRYYGLFGRGAGCKLLTVQNIVPVNVFGADLPSV